MNLRLGVLAALLCYVLAACGAETAPVETLPSPTFTQIIPSPTLAEDQRPLSTPSGSELIFAHTFGGEHLDIGINLIQTDDGGYALLGYTESFGEGAEDIYLVRLDAKGQALWEQTYGGEGTDDGWGLIQAEDGGFVILGFSNSFADGDYDFYLLRTDPQGELLWSQTYGGPDDEFGWAIAPIADDGFLLVGQTNSVGAGNEDAYVVAVDSQGNELWSQTYGGENTDRVFAVANTSDGGYVLAGITNTFGAGSRDAYLVKISPDGTQDWDLVLGEQLDDVAHAISATGDGGFIVIGYTRSFDAANYDTLLFKVSAGGDLEWQSVFGELGEDRTISGEQTADGGYIIAGYTQNYRALNWDLYLVKTDSIGNPVWYQTFGGNSEDRAYAVMETGPGEYMLIGHTFSSGHGGGDLYNLFFQAD